MMVSMMPCMIEIETAWPVVDPPVGQDTPLVPSCTHMRLCETLLLAQFRSCVPVRLHACMRHRTW